MQQRSSNAGLFVLRVLNYILVFEFWVLIHRNIKLTHLNRNANVSQKVSRMNTYQLLVAAASEGNALDVQRLMADTEARQNSSEALRKAARHGHHECVKLLIPVSEPRRLDHEALCSAAANGHIKCVDLLLPVSFPKSNSSRALQYAVEFGHFEIAQLLYPVSKPSSALRSLKYNFSKEYKMWGWLEEKIKGERLAQRLLENLASEGTKASQRKM